MGNPKTIIVNNILRGYTDFEKVGEIYSIIKKDVLTEKPIQSSPEGLLFVKSTSNRGGYCWELYSTKNYEVMLEAWNTWEPFEEGEEIPESPMSRMELTFHRDQAKIKSSIEKILGAFPEEKRRIKKP